MRNTRRNKRSRTACVLPPLPMAPRRLKRANPKTIHEKFLVGYQGWFTCAGDGEPVGPGHHGWLHWFNYPIPDGGRPNTDLWPDVSSYSPSELFAAPGLSFKDGQQAFLFSSRHPKTVQRHFHWMAEHGVDGAFLQRFAGQCDMESGDNSGIRRIRDEVGDLVMKAAEAEGRVFAMMYDVSGVSPDRIQRVLEQDWIYLIRQKGILDSPNYLREKGMPVLALWGFGFEDSRHTPRLLHDIIQSLRRLTPGGLYIMAGTPASWRTADNDADRDEGFLKVWLNEVDAISPWTIGRYGCEEDFERFAETRMKDDVDMLRRQSETGGKKIDYLPVVLPGGSGYNLSEGKWTFNGMKRNGGRFLWKQIFHAKRLGVRSMYGAMWDEYDEGTAFMPCVAKTSDLPRCDKYDFLALDADGYEVPPDWYMRICGFAGEGLRSERRIHESFPYKELEDYWASRPRYDDGAQDALEAAAAAAAEYEEWTRTQTVPKDEPPPPPYSLEDEPAEPVASGSGVSPPRASGSGLSAHANSVSPATQVTTPAMAPAVTETPPSPDLMRRPALPSGVPSLFTGGPSTIPIPRSPSPAEATLAYAGVEDDFARATISGPQSHPEATTSPSRTPTQPLSPTLHDPRPAMNQQRRPHSTPSHSQPGGLVQEQGSPLVSRPSYQPAPPLHPNAYYGPPSSMAAPPPTPSAHMLPPPAHPQSLNKRPSAMNLAQGRPPAALPPRPASSGSSYGPGGQGGYPPSLSMARPPTTPSGHYMQNPISSPTSPSPALSPHSSNFRPPMASPNQPWPPADWGARPGPPQTNYPPYQRPPPGSSSRPPPLGGGPGTFRPPVSHPGSPQVSPGFRQPPSPYRQPSFPAGVQPSVEIGGIFPANIPPPTPPPQQPHSRYEQPYGPSGGYPPQGPGHGRPGIPPPQQQQDYYQNGPPTPSPYSQNGPSAPYPQQSQPGGFYQGPPPPQNAGRGALMGSMVNGLGNVLGGVAGKHRADQFTQGANNFMGRFGR
ncbi:hypothetical protein CYLTODRAFT_491661 [Cylindrobasidium torrendii FP15055 ss-10]|uniref:Xylosidase/arabinosidase n=1 Tax=Cylindrobasidium torrendii FP15055 ss-10 TaxID=1314674 RepID=A0A0D7B7L2_9AGAR|nr:hypothetical protein CYLTODRAFT_491661 [Cylindrobasidium torrendii FP15055 ss-10]